MESILNLSIREKAIDVKFTRISQLKFDPSEMQFATLGIVIFFAEFLISWAKKNTRSALHWGEMPSVHNILQFLAFSIPSSSVCTRWSFVLHITKPEDNSSTLF